MIIIIIVISLDMYIGFMTFDRGNLRKNQVLL